VENHLGLIHQTWSDFEEQRGRDASGHLNGAIAAYERATRMEPSLLPAWINLGTCLQQRAMLPKAASPEADLQAALRVLEQARTLNPRHFVPYFVQGRVFHSMALRKQAQGEDPEPDALRALEAHKRALAINGGVPHMHNGIGLAQMLLARNAWERGGNPVPFVLEAEQAFRRAIAVAPGQVLAYVNLGGLLTWKARHERDARPWQTLQEAESLLRKTLVSFPEDQGALTNLGRVQVVRLEEVLRSGGDFTQFLGAGEAIFARVLARDPHHGDALQYLGELRVVGVRLKLRRSQVQRKDYAAAEEALQKALELHPEAQECLLELARLHLSQAEWARATAQDPAPSLSRCRGAIEQVLKVRPNWAGALALRGALLLEEARGLTGAGRSQQAVRARMAFQEAFSTNRHLVAEWAAASEQAHQLSRSGE